MKISAIKNMTEARKAVEQKPDCLSMTFVSVDSLVMAITGTREADTKSRSVQRVTD